MKYAPYSYSRISTFLSCPFAFKCRYIDGIEEPLSPGAERGKRFHRTVAKYIMYLRANSKSRDHEFLDKILSSDKEIKFYYESPLQKLSFTGKGDYLIEAGMGVDENLRPASFEKAFLRGITDLVIISGDSATIVDWKTAGENSDILQDEIYALLVFSHYKYIQHVVCKKFHFYPYSSVKTKQLSFSRKEKENLKQEILALVNRIEREQKFSATPNGRCSVCGYTHICPAFSSALPVKIPEVKKPESPEHAKKLAHALFVLEHLKEKLQNVLKEWIREHDPIRVEDKVLGFHESVAYSWDREGKKEVVKKLVEAGVERQELFDLFSITKAALERFLRKKNLQNMLPDLLSIAKVKQSTRFCFK